SDGGVWDAGNDNRYQNYIEYLVNFLSNTNNRVLRGGSWSNGPAYCRCAYRFRFVPDYLLSFNGFRVACAPP
ncbi:serine/threonine protein kinase, partial [Arthrospira sp. PCC 8006]|uniref:formylglycine-generating enzyme family protein n=1 Tax=Arthrospira sp. PCC 8006 TaxID=1982224 RepID=UPI00396E0AC0